MSFSPRSLYAAFDVFPSAKGSSIHIEHMSETLFKSYGSGTLFTLGDGELPSWQREDDCEIIRFQEEFPNFLLRSLNFGEALERVAATYRDSVELAHFRDPWSGIPLIKALSPDTRFVFEVNGLPSIELPYHYPLVSQRTLQKIREEERACWERADAIVTPSQTIADNLVRLGADAAKMSVIPNGADLAAPSAKPEDAPARYLIYFGALQRWQGVDTLLKAMQRLTDFSDLKLLICSSSSHRQAKALRKLARNLDLEDRIVWKDRLTRAELAPYLQHATLSIAPLTECSRNVSQGCCPLKILESVAAGVPIVASQLPSVEEILADGHHARLVPPERPNELARAIRILLEYPAERERLAANAKLHLSDAFSWQSAQAKLAALYQSLQTQSVSLR